MLHRQDKIWDIAQTWQKYCSPARPDASELDIAQQLLKPGMKVLLLGSTPEYRDLFTKHRCHATVIDYSEDNFHAMTKLMRVPPQNETFVEANWLDMPIVDKFDLIIGDHVINLLPLALWPVFLEKIKSLLNPGAFFLQRIITRTVPYNKSKEDVFSKTAKLDGPALFSRTFYDLLTLSMDQAEQSVCLGDTWKLVEKINSSGLLTLEQFQHFQSLSWENSQVKAYITSKEYILEQIQKFFVKNSIVEGEIYYKDLTFFILSENS